ncbi:MAG: hypothetical protein AAGI69_23410 [Cyanobacteria bacterium P01_H01_bin.21]
MKLKSCLLTGCFCLGLLAVSTTTVGAQVQDIQTINQPIILKLSITAIGLGLMALELWWFLAKKS